MLKIVTIRTDQKFPVSMVIIATVGILAIGLTATTMQPVQATGNPCPSGDSCTCNAVTGVLTDSTNGYSVHDGCSNDANGNPIN
jgi:hypothetical protein